VELNTLLYMLAPQSHNHRKALVENFQMREPNSFISFLPEVNAQGVCFDFYYTHRLLRAVRMTSMLFLIERYILVIILYFL
jgi:hypothetical protein